MSSVRERKYRDKSTTEVCPFRSVLFLVLLASGGYLLFHHHAFTNSNPPSPTAAAGTTSTPCDCTTSPPPPCECNNATTTEAEEEEMASISSNNRRPSINLQIICPTPPPLVDRQVMPSDFPSKRIENRPFSREARAAGGSTCSTRLHRTRPHIREWGTHLKPNQIQFISTFVKRTISERFFANVAKYITIKIYWIFLIENVIS